MYLYIIKDNVVDEIFRVIGRVKLSQILSHHD